MSNSILSVGTTDHPCGVTDNPTPSEAEIQFILKEIRNYLSPDVNGGCTWVLCESLFFIVLHLQQIDALMWKRWCKRSNGDSIRSPVVDEERIKPDHWLGSLHWVSCSCLTLVVGWQEGHLVCENPCLLSLNVLFQSSGRKKTKEELGNPGSCVPEQVIVSVVSSCYCYLLNFL